jgi:hypothetical protein
VPAAFAHLLHVLLHLSALLRREHVHDLRAKLLARLAPRLPIRLSLTVSRVGLAELMHNLLDPRSLLIGQVHAAHHAHEAAMVSMAALPLALALRRRRRRLPGLLRKHCYRQGERGAERRGKKKSRKGFHWVVALRGWICSHLNR